MQKSKNIVAVTSAELAVALGLSKEDGVDIELRNKLNSKIVQVVKARRLTHAEVTRHKHKNRYPIPEFHS